MREERLKVLEILQEGKINAEEAARLLEALNKLSVEEDDDEEVEVKVNVETRQHEDG